MPERLNADLRSSRTDLGTDLGTGIGTGSMSNGASVRIGGGRWRRNGDWVRFGAWNVRSIRGREDELFEEMERYRLEVLGVSESKLKGSGAKAAGEGMCVFSGVQEGRAKAGVAVLLSKRMSACLREWKCVSERIVRVRLRIEGVWVSVIQVYAPTEDCRVEMEEEFYEQLQVTVREVHRQDKLVVMGDLNARVGDNVKVWGEVIGKQGEAVENGNGKRLLQFCAENDLVVTNSWFQHKDIHKFTWECRGRNQRSIIDYFLVKQGMRKQLRDVKVVRGAEIGSDHYLLVMVIKLKVQASGPRETSAGGRIRARKLINNATRGRFEARLLGRYRLARHIGSQSIEEAWVEVK